MRDAPANIRFLSIEPMLEDLGALNLSGMHWVIVGGESGAGARPMQKECVLSIRDQLIPAERIERAILMVRGQNLRT